PRGIVGMRSHRPALGTLDAPIPFSDEDLLLFGRHSTLPAPRCLALCDGLRVSLSVACVGFHLLGAPSRPCRTWSVRGHVIQRPLNDLTWRRFRLRIAEDRRRVRSDNIRAGL